MFRAENADLLKSVIFFQFQVAFLCIFCTVYLVLGLLILFVKVPRSGNSEGTFSVFESSCHLLLPVKPLKGRGNPIKNLLAYLQTILFYAERQAGKL